MVEESSEGASQPVRTDRRRELARHEGEQKKRRVAFALIGTFILVIVGIILAGYIMIFVLPPRELIVRVDDVEYTRGDMVKMLRVRQRGTELQGESFSAGTDIFEALQLIVENEIIAKSAPGLGITATEEEVDLAIDRVISPPNNELAGKTEQQLALDLRESYNSYLNAVQLTEDEHRTIIRKSILREKVRLFVGESVPSVAEQVRLHRIAVTFDDELDIINTKYKDFVGISKEPQVFQNAFFNITREFSRDEPEVIRRGGDMGWLPKGIFPEYDFVIFNLEPGEISDPEANVEQPQSAFIFMVSEASDAREVDPLYLNELKTDALQDWINEQRKDHEVFAVFNSEVYAWMVGELGITATITPTPEPNPFQDLISGGGL